MNERKREYEIEIEQLEKQNYKLWNKSRDHIQEKKFFLRKIDWNKGKSYNISIKRKHIRNSIDKIKRKG